jgi:hypothetical protein
MGDSRNGYRVLEEKNYGRKPLGRPSRRWDDTISMALRNVGWETWTGSVLLRIGTCSGFL